MNTNHWCRSAVVVGLVGTLAACYTQRPLETPTPAPATRIVAEVTDAGAAALSNEIGAGAVAIEGVLAETGADAWSLYLLRVEHRDGRSIRWNRELISLPRGALANEREKRLSRSRSWLAAGMITASAVVAAMLFDLIGADEMGNGEPTPPN